MNSAFLGERYGFEGQKLPLAETGTSVLFCYSLDDFFGHGSVFVKTTPDKSPDRLDG